MRERCLICLHSECRSSPRTASHEHWTAPTICPTCQSSWDCVVVQWSLYWYRSVEYWSPFHRRLGPTVDQMKV